jgi:hypothetical protein
LKGDAEMTEKQQKIVEMAKDICRYQPCCNDVCKPISACDALRYAERAVEAGYSKQSEVAREILEEIENSDSLIIAGLKHYIICERELADLKKKYTEEAEL